MPASDDNPPTQATASKQSLIIDGFTDAKYVKAWQLFERGNSVRPSRYGTFYVTSQTTPGKEYKLNPRLNGGYACECPDYLANHQVDRNFKCKHIICLEDYLKATRDARKYLEDDLSSLEKGLLVCRKCGSNNVRPWGSDKGIKCYQCRECKHRFREERLLKYFVHELNIITLCLDLYFSGLSSRKVVRNIRSHFHIKIDQRTVHKWIDKFIPIILKYVETLEPQLSNIWQADELFVNMRKGTDYKIRKRKILRRIAFLWSIMDRQKRFILASELSKYRDASGAKQAFRQAVKLAGDSLPELIATDGWRSYNSAIRDTFEGKPVQPRRIIRGIKKTPNAAAGEDFTVARMERLQGT